MTLTILAFVVLALLARNAWLWLRLSRAESQLLDLKIQLGAAELGRETWRRRYAVESKMCRGLQLMLRSQPTRHFDSVDALLRASADTREWDR